MKAKLVSVLVSIFIVTVMLPAQGSANSSVDYLVYKEGSIFIAKNTATGETEKTSGDAYTVIKYAIDKLRPTGGVVELAAGTYPMTSQLNVYSGIHLKGAGKSETILKCVSRFSFGIRPAFQHDFGISDLTYNGNNLCSIPLDVHSCSDFYVSNVHTANPLGCNQRYWARPDLGEAWCENGEVTDVSAQGAHGECQCMDFFFCRNFRLTNIEAWGSESDWGVDFHCVQGFIVRNMYIHDCWGAFKVWNEPGEPYNTNLDWDNVNIEGSQTGDTAWIAACENSMFRNIYFHDSTAGNYGLYVWRECRDVTITECTFENLNPRHAALRTRDATELEISYCNFIGNYPNALSDGAGTTFYRNYWHDYTGVDANGDGYGDTSYTFSSGTDYYPLMESYTMRNRPPTRSTITGETQISVSISYMYTFTSIDPDGNDVSYYVDWGDGDTTEWTVFGSSGEDVGLAHMWEEEGEYTIKVKAKDTYGAEGEWGELTVSMSKTKALDQLLLRFLERLLERFPVLARLLNL